MLLNLVRLGATCASFLLQGLSLVRFSSWGLPAPPRGPAGQQSALVKTAAFPVSLPLEDSKQTPRLGQSGKAR